MSNDTLMPCPFCGEAGENYTGGSGTIYVCCSNSNCQTDGALFDSAEAWNTRHWVTVVDGLISDYQKDKANCEAWDSPETAAIYQQKIETLKDLKARCGVE